MIKRVYGKADDIEITFYQTAGDTWKICVPWKKDGKYTAEIYVENDAGIISHVCKMMFIISGHELKACVIPAGEQMKDTGQKYHVELQEGGYRVDCIRCENTV